MDSANTRAPFLIPTGLATLLSILCPFDQLRLCANISHHCWLMFLRLPIVWTNFEARGSKCATRSGRRFLEAPFVATTVLIQTQTLRDRRVRERGAFRCHRASLATAGATDKNRRSNP